MLLCAQKSLLCGSTEPSDHSGPSSVAAGGRAGTEALGFREGGGADSRSSGEAVGAGFTGGTGARLVASGDGVGVGDVATSRCRGAASSFTADATA